MAANLLTEEDLHKRLQKEKLREQKARAASLRLKRAIQYAESIKRRQQQALLGRAIQTWCEADERVLKSFRNWLAAKISDPTDRALLNGTSFEIQTNAGEVKP